MVVRIWTQCPPVKKYQDDIEDDLSQYDINKTIFSEIVKTDVIKRSQQNQPYADLTEFDECLEELCQSAAMKIIHSHFYERIENGW